MCIHDVVRDDIDPLDRLGRARLSRKSQVRCSLDDLERAECQVKRLLDVRAGGYTSRSGRSFYGFPERWIDAYAALFFAHKWLMRLYENDLNQ